MRTIEGAPTTIGAPAVAASPLTTTGPIVLAADGSELAGNAARVAVAIARRRGALIEVLSVIDTRGAPIPPPLDVALAAADDAVGQSVHAAQASEVRTALGTALDEVVDWPVRVALGTPAAQIAQHALECKAGLVVVGLRHHGPLGRALQDETAIHVMRQATCPVLAVAPSLTGLARHVVVGMDFTRASVDAARVALGLLAPGGQLTLAYAGGLLDGTLEEGERRIHDLGVEAGFEAVVRELTLPADVTVARVRLAPLALRQRTSDLLLELAETRGADLVVLGARRHGRVERMLLGSVVTDVARAGRVSVLAVPPQE